MECRVGASAGTGANSTVALAAGASRCGATAANEFASSASGPGSFSSSWQSLLASLSTGATEPVETESKLQAAAASLAAADAGASTTPALATSLQVSMSAELGRNVGEAATSSVGAQVLAGQPAPAETRRAAARTESKTSISGGATDATGATRTAHSGKNALSDLSAAPAIPVAAQGSLEVAAVVAPVPVTANPLSSTIAEQTASSAASLPSGLSTASWSGSSSLAVHSDGILDAKEVLSAGDRLSQTGTSMTWATASQAMERSASQERSQSSEHGEVASPDAATEAASEASTPSVGHSALSSNSHSQAARSAATTSLAGSADGRGQTAPDAGLNGNVASNSASSVTVGGKAISTMGGSALPVESAPTQTAPPVGAIAGNQTAGRGPSQVPEAIQSQSTGASGASMGSGSSDALDGQAGNATLLSASVDPIATKSTVVVRNRGSEPATVRAMRESGKYGLTQQGIEAHGQLASAAGADAAATVRDPSAQGVSSATDHSAGESNSGATGLKETFAAIDAESTASKPAWIHTGAQRAEAGIQDPELGWVSVRADMGSGGVHASLVPGSADAAQALGGHLAGLNSFLSDHHTPVETLTLAAPESGWSGPGASAGQGQADTSGQNAGGNGETSASANTSSSATSLTAGASRTSSQGFEEMNGSASTVPWGGTHISVLA